VRNRIVSQSPFLPIVSPDPPRKTTVEKYGSLYYAAVAGLVVLVALVIVFALGVWSMRGVWADIYALNDPKRPELERINAAWRLSRDPRVTDRQKWDLAVSTIPPPLARYLLAESLSAEAAAVNPRPYALAVARSEGLPPFLIALLARPIAYAAAGGSPLDRESLEEVEAHRDPAVSLWATYAIALGEPEAGSLSAREALDREASGDGSYRKFAGLLRDSARAVPPVRQEKLDAATDWLRSHYANAVNAWAGWREVDTGIVAKS
jgi:hypothetical protein